MSDADTIRMLRAFVRDLRKKRDEVIAGGMKFHLVESGSLIDTITGYLDGDESGGWQSGDAHKVYDIRAALLSGANVSIGGVGFSRKATP